MSHSGESEVSINLSHVDFLFMPAIINRNLNFKLHDWYNSSPFTLAFGYKFSCDLFTVAIFLKYYYLYMFQVFDSTSSLLLSAFLH